jgi:hypothetical protein
MFNFCRYAAFVFASKKDPMKEFFAARAESLLVRFNAVAQALKLSAI